MTELKDRPSKTFNLRFHILGGAIFPIYDKIMGGSGIQSVKSPGPRWPTAKRWWA